MTISLLHCYSDFNKGDAAIIIGTVQFLKETFNDDIEINFISTFSSRDKRFKSEHKIIKNYCNEIYTALFHEPFIKYRDKFLYNSFAKIVSFIIQIIKFSIILLLLSVKLPQKLVLKLLLDSEEFKTFSTLYNSDIIISKGGSFIYTENNLRSFLIFLRLLFPFVLLRKMNKKVIILGQSIGPFKYKTSNLIFKYVLSACDKVYLREKYSIKYLNNLIHKKDKTKICFSPDFAFFIKIVPKEEKDKNSKNNLIGITARPFNFPDLNNQKQQKWNNYIETFVNCIEYFVQKKKYDVLLVPQVISEFTTDNDLVALNQIYEKLSLSCKHKVKFLKDNFTPLELISIYSELDFLIATRLHSAIFGFINAIPAVVISYQGTKAKGILSYYNLEEYVLDIYEITPKIMINKIEYLESNLLNTKNKLKLQQVKIINDFKAIQRELQRSYQNRNT